MDLTTVFFRESSSPSVSVISSSSGTLTASGRILPNSFNPLSLTMEYPWNPFPPSGNFCPVCSNSHFPFCPPPPPPPQYFRPPPPDQFFNARPPPPPQPSYDPFVDHQGGPSVNPYPPPPPAQVPPRPWSGNPNLSNSYCGNPHPDYDQNAQVGAKRMRSDNVNEGYAGSFSEDERRLKLIHDHGAATHGNFDGGYKHSMNSFETNNFSDKKGNFGDRQGINPQMKPSYGEQQFTYQHPENNKSVELGRSAYNHSEISVMQNHIYGNSAHGSDGYMNYKHAVGNHETLQYDNAAYQDQRRNFPIGSRDNQFLQPPVSQQHVRPGQVSPGFKLQPPLPTNPPPPLPPEPPKFRFPEPVVSTSAPGPGSLFPIAVDSASSFQSPYVLVSEGISSVSTHYSSKANSSSTNYYSEEIQSMKMSSSKSFKGEHEEFPPRHLSLDEPKFIDASHILKHPQRANRPDHIVIILRGLPGSGKSYLAKILRDLEIENGGSAPRIHSMDDYFMTEVEKVEESDISKSSGSIRGKKPVVKKVMEYCYEPEMEEAYRSSMLKAFKKTLDEGTFPFVIVDDRNLRVADFAQFWATAKRSGYEVYLLEATYKDPTGCAARNVHGFTQRDIHHMADKWEEAPSMYMKLDSKSLLHGDDLEENGIQEVDMDADDGNYGNDLSASEDINNEKVVRLAEGDSAGDGPLKDEQKEDMVEAHPAEVLSELRKSKWSNDLDEDDPHQTEAAIENSSALSNLIQSYSKKGKSVRWADKAGSVGFSIGSGKAANVSLIIGPGCGYNLKSNPLPEEEKLTRRPGEPRRQNIFQEQLRAERESFRAVFDKRRHRIGGLDAEEE